MAEVSEKILKREIRAIVAEGDLKSLTSRKVREKLEKKFGLDLTSRKEEIDSILMAEVDDHTNSHSEEDEVSEEEVHSSRKKADSDSDAEIEMSLKSKKNRKKIFLVGDINHQITGAKLPSKRQVLAFLFFNMRELNFNLKESANLVIRECIKFWEKARVPTKSKPNCVKKLLKLYKAWKQLQKNANKIRDVFKQREEDFQNELDNIFDIAHIDALKIMKIEEDKISLQRQREPRQHGCMAGIDKNLAEKEKTTRSRTEIFLVGHVDANITTSALPTKLQVLKKYFYHQKGEHLGRTKCLNLCLDAILIFWERACIPTMRRDSALRKMESLLKEFDQLMKNRYKKSESYREKEQKFKDEIENNIMDIAHSNAKEMMKTQEDIRFLEIQRENPRSCSMSPFGMKLYHKETRKLKSLEKVYTQKKDGDEKDDDDEYQPSKGGRKPKPGKKRKGQDDDDDSDDDWNKKKPAKKGPAAGGRGGGGKKQSAFTKSFKLSPELADVVGSDVMPRHEVVKKLWAVIKERDLQDPKNKQYAICDDQLMKVFGIKRFRTFGMMKHLKDHFLEAA